MKNILSAFLFLYLILYHIQVSATQQLPKHCSIKGLGNYGIEILKTSGNHNLDRSINLELQQVAKVFSVLPGFGFYDDKETKNAFATSETEIKNTKGTVVFGKNLLFGELKAHKWGGLAIAGIIAHEFAHIYQFQHPFLYEKLIKNQKTMKLVELHADYLSGYYLGRKLIRTPQNVNIKAFLISLYKLGDYDFNLSTHHGTPKQRQAAMIEGYKIGQKNNNINGIAEKGLFFVKNI